MGLGKVCNVNGIKLYALIAEIHTDPVPKFEMAACCY